MQCHRGDRALWIPRMKSLNDGSMFGQHSANTRLGSRDRVQSHS